ncbi:MAG TPA: ATP-binding protein, partial [Bacilli bacterium]|nr:ATP-binding protein [Bacilli bacterium]
IFIGINDKNKELVDVVDYAKLKLKIENKINDSITPRPRYEINALSYGEKTILEILVYPGPNKPYMYKGVAYQRSDTSTIPVDQTSLVELSLKGKNISYDQLETNEEELQFTVLDKKLNEVRTVSNFNKDILITLGLFTNDKYNIAASLLADKNNFKTLGIDIVRFGQTISEFIDRKTIVGESILLQYDGAIEMFAKHYPDIEIVTGMKRIKKQPVPYEAYREAIANAIAHRNYLIPSNIQIKMYNNRIEVISPGGLPNGLTKENYLKDNLSVPRNTIISQILHILGIIEKFGTGIRRINEAYFGYDKKPSFVIKDNFIKVILPNILFNDEDKNEEARILNLIDIKTEITRQDVENLLSVNKAKAVELLNKLKEDCLIESIGTGKNVVYQKK